MIFFGKPPHTFPDHALELLRHNQLYLLILRSLRQQASRRMRPKTSTGASWFETALSRLLTMRDYRRSKTSIDANRGRLDGRGQSQTWTRRYAQPYPSQ